MPSGMNLAENNGGKDQNVAGLDHAVPANAPLDVMDRRSIIADHFTSDDEVRNGTREILFEASDHRCPLCKIDGLREWNGIKPSTSGNPSISSQTQKDTCQHSGKSVWFLTPVTRKRRALSCTERVAKTKDPWLIQGSLAQRTWK